jgi:hypothetical protein
MGQLGFFDLIRRYESLDEKNDPLVAIAAMVPFESFRSKLKAALIKGELRTSDATRKSLAGRWACGSSAILSGDVKFSTCAKMCRREYLRK